MWIIIKNYIKVYCFPVTISYYFHINFKNSQHFAEFGMKWALINFVQIISSYMYEICMKY